MMVGVAVISAVMGIAVHYNDHFLFSILVLAVIPPVAVTCLIMGGVMLLGKSDSRRDSQTTDAHPARNEANPATGPPSTTHSGGNPPRETKPAADRERADSSDSLLRNEANGGWG